MTHDKQATPEVVGSRIAYDGFVRVRVDEVRLASGKETRREIVEHPGAVAVLALTDDDRVLLVRQWRHAAGRELLEVPAGTREPGEPTAVTARRELAEEAGYEPAALTEIASFYPTPGYSDERINIYRADGCRKIDVSPDPDEGIALVQVPIAEALGFLADPSGPIADGKTLIALLLLARERC